MSKDIFMKEQILVYPVIVIKCDAESGCYYSVTSPNIKGMITDGATLPEVIVHAQDAIATMISETTYPKVQDPTKWQLKKDEHVMWISVNMTKWLNDYGKTVCKNITIPTVLNDWAKENNINVSKVTTEALKRLAEI